MGIASPIIDHLRMLNQKGHFGIKGQGGIQSSIEEKFKNGDGWIGIVGYV
jgi:hypothetical protein